MKKREYGERVGKLNDGEVHSPSHVNNRGHGQRKCYIFKRLADATAGKRKLPQLLPPSDGLAPVPNYICIDQICNHGHQGLQIPKSL